MDDILNYLTSNKGKNLTRISPNIRLIESNHQHENGTIDILARDGLSPIGIKVGFESNITSVLETYLQYMPAGEILYVAPLINTEIYEGLKEYHSRGKLKFYEYTTQGNECFFLEIKASAFAKKTFPINKDLSKKDNKRNISSVNKDDKIEFIASTLVDMIPRRYSNLKKAYRLFKAL